MDCVCSLIVMLTTAVQLLRIERSAVHPLTRWTMHVGRSDSRVYQVSHTSGLLTAADVCTSSAVHSSPQLRRKFDPPWGPNLGITPDFENF